MVSSQWHDDRGETLIEVLAAVIILGLAGVAVLAGFALAITSSDIHRKETTGGAYAKSYAEAIQKYVQNNQSAFNCTPDYSAATVGLSGLPAGFTPTYTWSSVGSTGAAATCTANTVQLVTVTVTSSDLRATEGLSFMLRKPCSGDQGTGAPTKCT